MALNVVCERPLKLIFSLHSTGLGHYNNQESMDKLKGDIDGEKIVKVACVADNVLALNGNLLLFLE